MKTFEMVALLFFGAMWGSFFYTQSIRYINGSLLISKIKALFSTSRCLRCQRKIAPIHLVPIIGYLILKGRCNNCGTRIPLSYPAFEVLYGILLVLIIEKHGINTYSFTLFLLSGLAISISIIDVKTLTIPNSFVFIFVMISIYPIILNHSLMDNFKGLLLMFSFFIVVLLLFPGSFGGGDMKFASAIGFFLGIELSIVALEIALISGSIVGTIYAIKTRKGLRIKIPFAPFLSLGTISALLYGRDITLLYYNLVY